jgi:hypothetical protein
MNIIVIVTIINDGSAFLRNGSGSGFDDRFCFLARCVIARGTGWSFGEKGCQRLLLFGLYARSKEGVQA